MGRVVVLVRYRIIDVSHEATQIPFGNDKQEQQMLSNRADCALLDSGAGVCAAGADYVIYGNVPAGTSLRVIERKSWSSKWDEVSGAGSIGTPLEPIEPRISWSDNSHLVLDYPASTEGTGFSCESKKVKHVWIICRTHYHRIRSTLTFGLLTVLWQGEAK